MRESAICFISSIEYRYRWLVYIEYMKLSLVMVFETLFVTSSLNYVAYFFNVLRVPTMALKCSDCGKISEFSWRIVEITKIKESEMELKQAKTDYMIPTTCGFIPS